MDYKYFLLVSVCFTITVSEENQESTAEEKDFEKDVIQAYRAACERLQDLTYWTSIILEAKGLWTSSLSRPGRLLLADVRNRAKRDVDDKISCASFRNLQKSKGTYILGQVTLIRILSDLGGEIIKAGKSRIKTSANTWKILQERVKATKLFREDSRALLKAVRDGSEKLIQQVNKDSERLLSNLKELGFTDGSVRFLQDRKKEITQQLQSAVEV